MSSRGAFEQMDTPDRGSVNRVVNTPTVKQNTAPNFSPVGVAKAVGGFVGQSLMAPVNLVKGTQRNLGLDARQATLENSMKVLDAKNKQLMQAKANRMISPEEYKKQTRLIGQEYQKLSEVAKGINSDHYGAGDVAKDYANTAALALTVAAPWLKGAQAVAGVSGAAKATGVAAQAGAKAASVSNATKIAAIKAAQPTVGGIAKDAAVGVAKNSVQGLERAFGVGTRAIPKTVPGLLKYGTSTVARQALINKPTIDTAAAIPEDLQKKDFKKLAMDAGTLASPLAIGGIARLAKTAGPALTTAMYGREGFFTGIAKQSGIDLIKFMDNASPNVSKRVEATLRKVQQYNLDNFDGDARAASAHFVEYLKVNKTDFNKLTPAQLHIELERWVKANVKANEMYKAGKLLPTAGGKPIVLKDGEKIVAGRWEQSARKNFMEQAGKATDAQGRLALLKEQEILGADFTKNPTLMRNVKDALGREDWKQALKKAMGTKSLYAEGKLPNGYFPTVSKNAKSDFKKLADTAQLDRGQAANKVLGKVGTALDKAGISTRAADEGAYLRYKATLADEIGKVPGLKDKSTVIATKLSSYAENQTKTIVDERQFSAEKIKEILGVTSAQARSIKKAYTSAYSKMSTSDLGLAGKIENSLYKIPGFGTYRRIQGAARYQYNPFFRLQEGTETTVLGHLVAKGKADVQIPVATKMYDRIFNGEKGIEHIDDTVRMLKDTTSGNKAILAGGGYFGSAASANTFTAISAKLGRWQERQVGGLVNAMAKSAGKSPDDFIKGIDEKDLNAIRQIVQYPRDGFVSSNFVKALNLLIFPSRYNIKLAGIMGRSLADAPAIMQIATLKGLSDLNGYLKSDEGIKWQADNATVLGIINYLNPAMSLQAVFKALNGSGANVGDFGQIGGLPLGAISQMLQTTGVVPHANSDYIDPRTGEVIPRRVPVELAGAVKLALQDLVGSMYSFPGRTFGTSLSKRSLTEGALPFLKPARGEVKDSTAEPKLTPGQKRTQEVLKARAVQSSPTTVNAKPSKLAIDIQPFKTRKPDYKDIVIPTKPKKAKASSTKAPKAPKAPKPKVYGKRPV